MCVLSYGKSHQGIQILLCLCCKRVQGEQIPFMMAGVAIKPQNALANINTTLVKLSKMSQVERKNKEGVR